MKNKARALAVGCIWLLAGIAPSLATGHDGGRSGRDDATIVAFSVENDFFAGTDRNYTNGLRLSATSPDLFIFRDASELTARTFMLADEEQQESLRFEVALGQSIFTPEDRLEPGPLPDQHPYAGWLYLELSVFVERKSALDTLTIQAGVVGPAAGGEFVQNNFHDFIDDDRLAGWDNQLENEPGLAISFDRKFRVDWLYGELSNGLGVELMPNAGVAVGNVLTQANAGLTLRVGTNLRQSYGPPRIRPALGGATLFRPDCDNLSAYLFAGVEGRAVAQNIFLDGNTWRESLSVDKKPLVADFQVGAVVQIFDWQASYTYVTRTEEFETQSSRQQFGAISLVKRF